MENMYCTQNLVARAAIWTGENHRQAWDLITGKVKEPMQTYDNNFRITHDKKGRVRLYIRYFLKIASKVKQKESLIPYGWYIVRFNDGQVQFMTPQAFELLFVPIKDL